MTQLAYHYRCNGEPVMELDYHCGAVTGLSHATTWLDNPVKGGEEITLHTGYGVYHTYKVIDADKETALIQR